MTAEMRTAMARMVEAAVVAVLVLLEVRRMAPMLAQAARAKQA